MRILAANCGGNGAEIGRNQPSQTIDDFLRVLWEPLPAQGFEFTSEETPEGMQMHCTRCPLVDLAAAFDAKNWFYHFACAGDPHMVAGFNPNMGFRRTKTLMEGDEYCDHFYFMKES